MAAIRVLPWSEFPLPDPALRRRRANDGGCCPLPSLPTPPDQCRIDKTPLRLAIINPIPGALRQVHSETAIAVEQQNRGTPTRRASFAEPAM
jgi:hypothetical protein